ncbi:MAG: AAA family ATPase [Planctomycetota bacterium]
MIKPLYISATLQDCGKTCVICGLMHILQDCSYNPAYIKPVGQRYIEYEGNNIDEDAVLMHKVFGLPDQPKFMSPIAIERGFTGKFAFHPDVAPLEEKILHSVEVLSKSHPMLVIEGTGHAGVGSCFGLSNARVAELLGAEVVIVTTGGIGRPIDEIALSLALFRQHKVKVIGVILNKVLPEKIDKIKKTVAKGMENLGSKLLGAIPYKPELSSYTMNQIAEEFKYTVLCGHRGLQNSIHHTVVAAMEPQNMLRYIQDNTLIITPGDRIDNILISIVMAREDEAQNNLKSGGLILSGGFKPYPTILPLLHKSNIPVLITDEDTFTVSTRMKDLEFKIQSNDTQKIETAFSLVNEHVDVKYILDALTV